MYSTQMSESATLPSNLYSSGEYYAANPYRHSEDAAWKAGHIRRILSANGVQPKSICEIGCGSGHILRALATLYPDASLHGRDIAPQALEMSAEDGISRSLGSAEGAPKSDVVMAIDVFEHVDDYPAFLREMRQVAPVQVYHIPLDISVQGILRNVHMRNRIENGHIHQFTRETALAALEETGHTIVEWRYTSGAADLPKTGRQKLAALPRRAGLAIAPDLTVKVMGGFSMMVLCR